MKTKIIFIILIVIVVFCTSGDSLFSQGKAYWDRMTLQEKCNYIAGVDHGLIGAYQMLMKKGYTEQADYVASLLTGGRDVYDTIGIVNAVYDIGYHEFAPALIITDIDKFKRILLRRSN